MPKGNLYDRARLNLGVGGAAVVAAFAMLTFARNLVLTASTSPSDTRLIVAGSLGIFAWIMLAVGVAGILVGIVDLVQAAREPWFIADATDDERDVVARGAYERARPPV